jgi:hypothetical protein
MRFRPHFAATAAALLALALFAAPRPAAAHCDTLDGPVVIDARAALASGNPDPILKWVRPGDEAAIREAFARTRAVRALGQEAAALADTWFFETLVRIHRAGEGAPFTGLKPAGSVERAVAMADAALAAGTGAELAARIAEHTGAAVTERYARVRAARERAGESVEAGREYVAAYVDYVHFVEAIVGVVHGGPAHAH